MPPADPLRYSNNTREMRKTMARMPWRTRTRKKKPATHVLTPAEKQAAATASHEAKVAQNMLVTQALVDVWNVADRLHKDTGKHTAHYWYEHLVQKAGKSKKTRRPNSWNAFVSKQVKAYNDALPADTPRVKATAIMSTLRREWLDMSLVEREDFVEEAKAHLEEVRDMKQHATHNVAINAYHDVRGTLASVYAQLEYLSHRTGTEIMVVGSRSQSSSFLVPFTWSTSDQLDEHFQLKFKMSPAQYAAQLECYLLSGVEGAVRKSENDLLALKKMIADLIMENLQLVARPHQVSRMYYRDFDTHITQKLGIVVKNWPLSAFVCPSQVGSRMELNVLYNAWKQGTTYFERLTDEQFDELRRKQADKIAMTQGPVVTTTTNTRIPSVVPDEHPVSTSDIPPTSALQAPSPAVVPNVSSPDLATTSASIVTPVFSISASQLVQKKPRKERSDKGKKRGPRKRSSPADAA